MKSQKFVFLYALIFAAITFFLGLSIGIFFEDSRIGFFSEVFLESELSMSDAKLQSDILRSFDIGNCDYAVETNINLGDRIYQEARQLERLEEENRIKEIPKLERKRFDLLRTLFWVNSMEIQKKCNVSYINVVYIFKFDNPSLDIIAKQRILSNALGELKRVYGNQIILIPIAGDSGLTSVNTLMSYYEITDLPSVLINERVKVTEFESIEALNKIISEELGL